MKNIPHLMASMIVFVLPLHIYSADTPGGPPPPQQEKKKTPVVTYDPDNKEASELIPLKGINYSTVEEFCRKMLSDTGTMGYMPERKSIIVHDFRKNIDKIREFINTATAGYEPAKNVNIRIDIDYQSAERSSDKALNIDVNYSKSTIPGQVIMKNGKLVRPESVTFSAKDNSSRSSSTTSQFIVTMSGKPARLWVGKTIADPSWLNNYKLAPTYVVGGSGGSIIIPGSNPDIVWSNVGTYLYALPVYLGDDMIEVEVYPAVSYLDGKGKEQAVKVESLSTKLTVKSGQKIAIGGVIKGKNNFYRNFFGASLSNTTGNSVLDMYLTARVMKP